MPAILKSPEETAARCHDLRSYGIDYFVVSTAPNLASFDTEPLGVKAKPVPVFEPNPYGWDTDSFLKLFHSMDTHLFAGRGLAVPSWVVLDHAVLSSGLIIAACDQASFDALGGKFRLGEDDRFVLTSMKAEAADLGFTGPIPVASYCAAPTADPGRRIGWSLCSVLPRSGLGFLIKALGLRVYGVDCLSGTTQYDNMALRVHTKFGPARLLSALSEIHTAEHTLVYQTDCRAWFAGGGYDERESEPSWVISATDSECHTEMQAMIDAKSHSLWILPPGVIVEEGDRRVPILVADYTDPYRLTP